MQSAKTAETDWQTCCPGKRTPHILSGEAWSEAFRSGFSTTPTLQQPTLYVPKRLNISRSPHTARRTLEGKEKIFPPRSVEQQSLFSSLQYF